MMQITAYKTHKVKPGESLHLILDQYLPKIAPQSIIIITSKVVALCQNRIVHQSIISNKLAFIQNESDFYLEGDYIERYGVVLTMKNHILIPTAGIDASNGNGYYILYPEDPQKTATEIWQYCRTRYPNQEMGVLITDSHTTPLRRGVVGIALAWCGFAPLYSYIGKLDIFNNLLRVSMINILDGLAASAVLVMGEGNEQTPLAII
ncbi:coenzyme F420-0:L-glutamate ligase [Candidatus Cardinium hertigii]|uniref:coenzyme F420-0:L-glutamate ligase n=1 Tax=Candidatus Cardinium hertigii TaxID=247481 RepID=UPI003D7D7D23